MFEDLIWGLKDTCWLRLPHCCFIIHLWFVEGVLKWSRVDFCQVSSWVILSKTIKSVNTVKPSRFLCGIGPDISLFSWSTLCCTLILVKSTRTVSELLISNIRALKAVWIFVISSEGNTKVCSYVSHAIRIRNCYWEILVHFAIRLYFCQGNITILERGKRKSSINWLGPALFKTRIIISA